MNEIRKSPIDSLGYHFIETEFLPKGRDEYYLRNRQNKTGINYRKLTAFEIEALVRNRNTSDNWNNLLVSDAFTPELVRNCKFFGLVRIGKLEPYYLEFHNLRSPVGLYNSTIISSDFGNNVSVDNVHYLSHYIIGNDVMIVNVNELATTETAKFGNGILKDGESESKRIWLEVCNENGGRSIVPFDGMLPGDAWLWSRFRDDDILQNQLKTFTQKQFDSCRGYYGQVGDRTVIKNCSSVKDVMVGTDAYLKGANKLKNLTINSSATDKTQIGEGCELVNGIVDFGCRIFYGVKAVRFIMASHSQLKYGARLINSYLGNNSTISCCEVLNSLIFPAHEQHHNNSFLCAALVMGQSNMAAGATIGSNHNSRSADGEISAGRGFWPGLCVSLKHNSQFASFNILAKGDYPAELNIPIPFALVSNDVSKDELTVMPGYWFLYNMYALARNARKYVDRDARTEKLQHIEYDFLAPDSVNEMTSALRLIELSTGRAHLLRQASNNTYSDDQAAALGKRMLVENNGDLQTLEIVVEGFEHSDRKVKLIKSVQGYNAFREMIAHYVAEQLLLLTKTEKIKSLDALKAALPQTTIPHDWINIGGQLIKKTQLQKLVDQIHSNKVRSWQQVHQFYSRQGLSYKTDKLQHALSCYKEVFGTNLKKADNNTFKELFVNSVQTRDWMTKNIYNSRAKDYSNPFRKMSYSGSKEMDRVTGSLKDNSFIAQEQNRFDAYKKDLNSLIRRFKL